MTVGVKCSPSASHNADLCPPDECQTQEYDRVLGPAAAGGGGAVDYMRYCFYECKPLAGLRAPRSSECVDLDNADVKAVTDGSGDAKDPAVAMLAAAAAATRNRTASLLAARTRAKLSPREAEAYVKDMTRQAATQAAAAKSQAAESRKLEISKANTLKSRMGAEIAGRKVGVPVNPYTAMTQIHKSMLVAEEWAQKAGQSMQDAMVSLHSGRQKAWDAAVGEGQAAMMGVKDEKKAWDDAKAAWQCNVANDCSDEAASAAATESKMAEAAAKAAEPYHLSMLRSQQAVQDYTTRAEKSAGEAVAWEAKSKGLQAEANAEKAKGNMDYAEEKITEAKEWMKRAKDLAAQAKHFFATADAVNVEIPKFAAAAQAAAVRAAFDQQPSWQAAVAGGSRLNMNSR